MKKVRLNKNYYLTLCSSIDDGAMNAFNFHTSEDWVMKKDNGERYATRFTYSTLFAKKQKLYFDCGTAKAAIQQAIIEAFKPKSLKEIFFIIHYKIEPRADFDVALLEAGDCIWHDGKYREIKYVGRSLTNILIDFEDGCRVKFIGNEECIIM